MLWWGRFDPDYSRNRVLRNLLKEAGWYLDDFIPRFSSLGLIEARLRNIALPDAVWVPAFRHRDFLAARRFANKHNIPLIFDPLISAWDKAVYERKKFRETDRRACKLLKWEKQMFATADLVIADTVPHARFFIDSLSASEDRTYVIPVGAEEAVFKKQPASLPTDPPEIFFYGSFIDLQGTEIIIGAAIQVPEAHWVLLGNGPMREVCEHRSRNHSHISFEDWIPYEKLPDRIGEADILLGIFGTSAKAERVIPNKVYQSLACGRPLVTRQSPAYSELLQKSSDCGITFIPPGDPDALAAAVRTLLADPLRLPKIGEQASNSFDTWFSENHLQEALSVMIAELA